MFNKKQFNGKTGEDAAAVYLEKAGYRILARNFRIRGGEVDIVAIDQDALVFIEVKTRSSSQFGTPLEAITPWKLKALIKTAQFYKQMHKNLPELMRIDAVCVNLDNDRSILTIELVKNISS